MKYRDGPSPKSQIALREDVKKVELEAERLQQEELEQIVAGTTSVSNTSDSLDMATSNLRRYCKAESIDLSPETVNRLVVILTAAFPSVEQERMPNLFA